MPDNHLTGKEPTESPILITGGAGFIGSHLADLLLQQGYRVRVLDNLSSGSLANLPSPGAELEFLEGDVADSAQAERAVSGCRAVVHLAAVASVPASVADPLGTHRSNFIGTLNICQAMVNAGVRRIVYASSAAVYGQNGEGQAIAEDTPKAPMTPYGVDKLAGEYYLDFYRRQHGLEPVIFRLFNVFGPRQNPSSPYSGVISIFADRATSGTPITLYGDGEQTRDFVYVADLVQILLQALQAPRVLVGAVNVGLGRSTTLNQLLADIGQLAGGLPPVRHAEPRPGDIRHSLADNGRLLSRFRLPRPTSLQVGLAHLMAGLK